MAKTPIVNVELLRSPIYTVWNHVAGDLSELGRVTNKGAIECCIDADRMTSFAHGEQDKAAAAAAETELTRAIDANGYAKVLSALARAIRLV
jgi:hypothetical protein